MRNPALNCSIANELLDEVLIDATTVVENLGEPLTVNFLGMSSSNRINILRNFYMTEYPHLNEGSVEQQIIQALHKSYVDLICFILDRVWHRLPKELTKINFANCGIDDTLLDCLLNNLRFNKWIGTLNLASNCIGNIGLIKIVDFIREHPTLKTVNLEGNCICSFDGENLAELVGVVELRQSARLNCSIEGFHPKFPALTIKLGLNYLSREAIQYLNDRVNTYSFCFASQLEHQINHLTWLSQSTEISNLQLDSQFVYLVRDTRPNADTEHVMLLLQSLNDQGQVELHRVSYLCA